MSTAKLFRSAWLIAALTPCLLADPVSGIKDLSEWKVTGSDASQLVGETGLLTLPANAQLFRAMTGEEITVRLESSPVFAEAAADLPVLELGDTAVAFLRNGETGKLVLVLGNNPALVMPYEVVLGPDGRSEEPLSITLSRQGATVALNTRGQTLLFPGGMATGPQEIVLSAGAIQSWSIHDLAVTSLTPTAPDTNGSSSSDLDQARSGRVEQARNQAADAAAHVGAVVEEQASADINEPTTPAGDSSLRPITLEVFTPPAVRHGRIRAVRAAVVEAVRK